MHLVIFFLRHGGSADAWELTNQLTNQLNLTSKMPARTSTTTTTTPRLLYKSKQPSTRVYSLRQFVKQVRDNPGKVVRIEGVVLLERKISGVVDRVNASHPGFKLSYDPVNSFVLSAIGTIQDVSKFIEHLNNDVHAIMKRAVNFYDRRINIRLDSDIDAETEHAIRKASEEDPLCVLHFSK